MTTIAATEEMVAADTQVTTGKRLYYAGKIFRTDTALIACAGHNSAIKRFMDWWMLADRPALKLPKRLAFSAIVLNDEGLFVCDEDCLLDRVSDGVIAIGSGKEVAMAALDTMKFLNRKQDPRIAVAVAAHRDTYTGGTIESVRWRKRKA